MEQQDTWHDVEFQRRLAGLLRATANDLKRNDEAAEADLSLAPGTIADLIAGRQPVTRELIERAATAWPVNERDLLPIHDDCPDGVRLHRHKESVASSRTVERADRPYYEYRDTAMSRLASFRPEWIRMLCTVNDDSADNPAVQWNNGHLLYQLTYFVGPVNYYYRWGDERHCVPMHTGDSVFGVPFAPHSFTARSADEPAYILALTYGGDLTGDAQRELAVLGRSAAEASALPPDPAGMLRTLLDERMLTVEEAAAQAGLPYAVVADLVQGRSAPAPEQLVALAEALRVSPRELLPVHTRARHGVAIQRADTAARWPYPNRDRRAYQVTQLAGDPMHPHTTAAVLDVLPGADDPPVWLATHQHQYTFLLGDAPARLRWRAGGEVHEADLEPGDSCYIKPHTSVALSADAAAQLLVLRIGGAVTTEVRYALGAMAEGGIARYVSEDRMWYRSKGDN